MTKYPVRIHAGNNGVYDAVYRPSDAKWRICYCPHAASLMLVSFDQHLGMLEFSVTSYESAHEAMLAYERGPIAYRTNEVVA